MNHDIQHIPLSKLVASPSNVRRTGRKNGIRELAASIKAHGLLQNLTVRRVPKDRKHAGLFEVVAGGRRLAALKELAKRKALTKNSRIPCKVMVEGVAEEISLAENFNQCPMHPADQYEAFALLHDEQGMSAEDIAARFGITAAVVKQRLRLGAVSPILMTAYRNDELNLDQLSAFAITDDHAKQERVWGELSWDRSRDAILTALSEGQVPSGDRRAVFIGAGAYEAAGGIIIRDLFDGESGGYFADAELLNRLVREKLQRAAETVLAEGWKWIVVEPEFDYQLTAGMRSIHPVALPLGDGDQAKLDALEARREALCEDDDLSEDGAAELERIEADIEALAGAEQFRPEQMQSAGAFVALGHDGQPRIERGYVRPEDQVKAAAQDPEGSAPESEEATTKPLSEKLVAELTTHRTSVLRDALGQDVDVAFIAVVHALAGPIFFPHSESPTCLQIGMRRPYLSQHAPGIAETPLERDIADRHAAWERRMPEGPDALWGYIAGLDQDVRMALLAHCASLSINAVHTPGTRGAPGGNHASILSNALALDMTAHWQPTVANYLGRVSKDRIVEAVGEGVSKEAAANIANMKKNDMAAIAEVRLAGKGWLPQALRG